MLDSVLLNFIICDLVHQVEHELLDGRGLGDVENVANVFAGHHRSVRFPHDDESLVILKK